MSDSVCRHILKQICRASEYEWVNIFSFENLAKNLQFLFMSLIFPLEARQSEHIIINCLVFIYEQCSWNKLANLQNKLRGDFFETNLELSKHSQQNFWIHLSFFKYLYLLGPEPAFGPLGLGGSSGGYSSHGYTSHASLRASALTSDISGLKPPPTECQRGPSLIENRD